MDILGEMHNPFQNNRKLQLFLAAIEKHNTLMSEAMELKGIFSSYWHGKDLGMVSLIHGP